MNTIKKESIIPDNPIDNKENSQLNNITNLLLTNYDKETLNNKIYLIQKQFEIKETQYLNQIQLLNKQLEITKQTQSLLKNKLEMKEKAITEFNNIIKDYQIELLKYKEELDIKKEKNMKYKEKLRLIKTKYSSASLSNISLGSYDKNIYDIKMKELIESINDKNDKMNEMQNKINELEITKNEYVIKNKNLENKNKEYKKINEELNKQLDEQKNEIDNINRKNEELKSSFNEKNKLLESKIEQLTSENSTIIKQSNDNIDLICNWIENYLYNDKKEINIDENNSQNIPLDLFNGKNMNEENKIDFIKLMKLLKDIRNKNIKNNEQ